MEYREHKLPLNGSLVQMEILRIYPFNTSINKIDTRYQVGYNFEKPWGNRIIRAIQASLHAVFSLTADSKIITHQTAGTKISLVSEKVMPGLISFDIFDDKYFVIYSGLNTVEVYTIEMYLHL